MPLEERRSGRRPVRWPTTPTGRSPPRIDAAIDQALADADAQGAVTPFLLTRLKEITGGRSLTANMALIRNNATAARIAVAYAALDKA